jgi:hypothetical protein
MEVTNFSIDRHVEFLAAEFENSEMAGYTSPGWYFWDEAQTGCYGPYASRFIAEQKLEEYCHTL